MIGQSVLGAGVSAVLGLISLSQQDAISVGEVARAADALVDEVLVLAGGTVLIGLGIGVAVSGAAVYVYQQKKIQEKLSS